MFASLRQLVSSGNPFPYTLGKPFPAAFGAWTHFQGVSKEDEAPVSIFRISSNSPSDPKLQAARNGVKRLKLVISSSQCHTSVLKHGPQADSMHRVMLHLSLCSLRCKY